MLVVSVLSLKGGVGKTSVTLGLAGAAKARGVQTLVVDLDPQANATTVLEPVDVRFTANDVLADSRSGVLAEAVAETGWGDYVDVLASEATLEHRNHPSAGVSAEHRLRSSMTGLTGYDLVLIDCPPSLGELTKNALAASHLALVVTEPTLFAVTGAHQALAAVDVVRRGFNLRLRPAGIVVNRFRAQSAEHRYRLDEMLAAYRDLVLDPVLPERSAITQAQGAFVPVQRWPSPGAREVSLVFAQYLDHLLATGPAARSLTKGSRSR
ncbi:MAG TPA: ParA family protein [Jiangellales bacterium]|nr:ParA family protein [Jiangellales bacterium]